MAVFSHVLDPTKVSFDDDRAVADAGSVLIGKQIDQAVDALDVMVEALVDLLLAAIVDDGELVMMASPIEAGMVHHGGAPVGSVHPLDRPHRHSLRRSQRDS